MDNLGSEAAKKQKCSRLFSYISSLFALATLSLLDNFGQDKLLDVDCRYQEQWKKLKEGKLKRRVGDLNLVLSPQQHRILSEDLRR